MFQNRKDERQEEASCVKTAENQSGEVRRLTGSILLPNPLFNPCMAKGMPSSWSQSHKESLEQSLDGSKLNTGQLIKTWISPLVAQMLKNLPAMQRPFQSLRRKDPLEEDMATHSSILVWRISWTEEPGRLQSTGLQRVGHDWVTKQQS